ncbi:hypothetical protein B0H11DRAFT_2190413 [Mycena galericulata]|nr:hypothetical protein B0H11DRAFT_2190413 [Mycena galericulata]
MASGHGRLPVDICIQKAIRRSVGSSKFRLKQYVNTLGVGARLKTASNQVADRASYERPAGHFRTLKTQILSVDTLALVMKYSDLDIGDASDRVLSDTLILLFGVIFRALVVSDVDEVFAHLLGATIDAADQAYLIHNGIVASHQIPGGSPQRKRVKFNDGGYKISPEIVVPDPVTQLSSLRHEAAGSGYIHKIIGCVSHFAKQEVQAFVDTAFPEGLISLPAAFITGFKSGLSTPDPQFASKAVQVPAAPVQASTGQAHRIGSMPKRSKCYPPTHSSARLPPAGSQNLLPDRSTVYLDPSMRYWSPNPPVGANTRVNTQPALRSAVDVPTVQAYVISSISSCSRNRSEISPTSTRAATLFGTRT